MDNLRIIYKFDFKDTKEKLFELRLDPKTLKPINKRDSHPHEWTRLHFHRCSNCEMDEERRSFCPVAVNLADVASDFSDIYSYEKVKVSVITEERRYLKETTVQESLSSLTGIIMATSGCTHLDYLRPMVRFHLPFATIFETTYRMLSMFLVALEIMKREGIKDIKDLSGLADIYSNVSIVNRDFSERLRAASKKDANLNAIVNLDCFANLIPLTIDETLEELKPYFSAYIKPSL